MQSHTGQNFISAGKCRLRLTIYADDNQTAGFSACQQAGDHEVQCASRQRAQLSAIRIDAKQVRRDDVADIGLCVRHDRREGLSGGWGVTQGLGTPNK